MAIDIDKINEIDKATTFEEIAKLRESSYLINKANGFNFQTLLSDLYTDPSHFIYELIQNAEDALASEVKIKLYEDRLVFSHNGKRLFNIDDIRAITGIGNSNKPEEDNKIGRFGIGFKAVFGVCESPKIYSGEFAFEINHLYVPRRIDKVKEYERGTHFVLPFKSKDMTTEDIYVLLYKAIEELDADTILFLRNVNEITWDAPNLNGFYLKTKTKKDCGAHGYYECDINHAPNVTRELFDTVQATRAERRAKVKTSPTRLSPFAGKVTCADCGKGYKHRKNNRNTAYEKWIWSCSTYVHMGRQYCGGHSIREDDFKALFLSAYNAAADYKPHEVKDLDEAIKDLLAQERKRARRQ